MSNRKLSIHLLGTIRETFRQYQSQKNLKELALEGKNAAKKKKLTLKDFGG